MELALLSLLSFSHLKSIYIFFAFYAGRLHTCLHMSDLWYDVITFFGWLLP